ncbi:MAG: hypothetical protein A2W22_06635 [Candidatus Levybacteria bacterium RBG_16_35_11]|nr:MAG: hypothetical protein A2W22_06635 [Candidatus Levybacteria bacterium RBG_16_35_11]
MDEKTIFQGQAPNPIAPNVSNPLSQSPGPENPQPVQPQPNQAISPPPPPFQPAAIPMTEPLPPSSQEASPPPPSEIPPVSPPGGEIETENPKRGGFKLKKILLILGSVIILLLLIFGGYLLFQRFQSSKSEKVTLDYWGLWEDSKVMDLVISDFQRNNPNITIKYSKQDINEYRQKLVQRIGNGSGPDIFRFHNSWPIMLSSYLLPLSSDIISTKEFKDIFYPVAQNDLIKNGAILGIPLEIDTLALYINDDLFKAAGIGVPQRWEDFASISAALTVKDDEGKIKKAGVALGTANNIEHASDIISLLFAQNGVDLENISSNEQNLSQALQYYTSFATSDSKVWDENQDSSLLAFSKGNLGMYFGYSYDLFSILALNPNLNFKIVSVPTLAGRRITIASYWVEGVSVKSKHQKEALLFLKFLAKKETEQKLYTEESKTRLFGEPYARVDLRESLKDNAIVYPFVEQASNSRSTYFSDSTFDQGINEELKTYLYNAVSSIVSDNTSPETAAGTLSKGFDQTLAKYGK